MKKTLVALGTLLVLAFGAQSFAACPCSHACNSCPTVAPCCPTISPCATPCPACPVASPCSCQPSCGCGCNTGCGCGCRKKCSWWKFWENKCCCDKCDSCCDDCNCNKCDNCCD